MIAVRNLVSTCFIALALCAALAAPAQAEFSIVGFDGEATHDDGTPWTQAGAHSNVHFDLDFSTVLSGLSHIPDGMVKTVKVDLPPGLVGNPTAVSTCSESQLTFNPVFGSNFSSCPPDSVVGTVEVRLPGFNAPDFEDETIVLPVANLQPAPGTAAQFGFNAFGGITKITAFTREGGRSLAAVAEVTETVQVIGAKMTLWGVPADESHDAERGGTAGLCGDEFSNFECESGLPPTPFMSAPTDCAAGPLTTTATANSWQHPDVFSTASFVSHLPGGTPTGVTGCDIVAFKPTISIKPTTREAGAPTGLEVELKVPQDQNPDGLATAHLKKAVTELPAGMTVNASQANGLAACSPTEIGLGNDNPVTCPDASAIGSLEVKTPLLTEPIPGRVYLAQQGTNPFNSLLALYLVAADPSRGILVKIPGKVSPDPNTGQLTAVFDQSPQLPFDTLRLSLDGGDRGALVTPDTCGTYTTHSQFTSWADQKEAVDSDSSFVIDQGCARKDAFTPGFEAGTENPVAGKSSPFSLRITRPDGQQNLGAIETQLPEGLVAKLAGVALCPDSAAVSGDCPASSRIGSVTVGAGAGLTPVFVPQPGKSPTGVYLAGPYKGAPYSLVVKVPAQAGPFDLGTVAVRNAIEINPATTEVTVKSDPLPQILEGIPVSYREVRVDVDRPDFTLNPTSCDPMAVGGVITSAAGTSARLSDRFQVGDCEALAFEPKLAFSLKGQTKRSGHPALKATLTFPSKGTFANIQRAQVGLPHSLFLDQGNIGTVCTQPQLKSQSCPPASVYGKAKAWSPLLDKPLEGPVYLGVGYGHKLPDLVADLNGQIRILLNGKVDTTAHEGLRNTFEAVPDAPVSKFTLELKGGKKFGLIENSENLCAKAQKASVAFTAHSGKTLHLEPTIANGCAGKKGKAKRG